MGKAVEKKFAIEKPNTLCIIQYGLQREHQRCEEELKTIATDKDGDVSIMNTSQQDMQDIQSNRETQVLLYEASNQLWCKEVN